MRIAPENFRILVLAVMCPELDHIEHGGFMSYLKQIQPHTKGI